MLAVLAGGHGLLFCFLISSHFSQVKYNILHLENSMNRGAWQATIHGVAKSDTAEATEHIHTHTLYQ